MIGPQKESAVLAGAACSIGRAAPWGHCNPQRSAQLANKRKEMSSSSADVVVIGAGAVGVAIAKRLAERKLSVIIVETASEIGSNTSRRNSGVIHSGIYYPSGSLRAKLCVSGKKQLYRYCSEKGVPHSRIGKLIVAKDKDQVTKLRNYLENGERNGVNDLKECTGTVLALINLKIAKGLLQWLSKADVKRLEPEVKCEAAVLSPSTGIVDLKSLIQAYMDDAQEDGAQLMLDSTVVSGSLEDPLKRLTVERSGSGQRITLLARFVVNSAGLNAQDVSRCLHVPAGSIPRKYYAKGNYFAFKGKPPFKHLIYPLPHQGGLGTHLTLDLHGGAKFGPDVEYQDDMNFDVNTSRMGGFYSEIREYWPGLPDDSLKPAFAGIRPKLHGPGEAQDDFLIDSRSVPGYIALYGIESPGLTSSLAIGGYVADIVQAKARL